jgi:hypothetical protein
MATNEATKNLFYGWNVYLKKWGFHRIKQQKTYCDSKVVLLYYW